MVLFGMAKLKELAPGLFEWEGRDWTQEDVMSSGPDWIWAYGDNDQRRGMGGSACIRLMPNTIGVRTKRKPERGNDAFYYDNTFQENKAKIGEDLNQVASALRDGKKVILPRGGLGSGLANLMHTAPMTWMWMIARLENIKRWASGLGAKEAVVRDQVIVDTESALAESRRREAREQERLRIKKQLSDERKAKKRLKEQGLQNSLFGDMTTALDQGTAHNDVG